MQTAAAAAADRQTRWYKKHKHTNFCILNIIKNYQAVADADVAPEELVATI